MRSDGTPSTIRLKVSSGGHYEEARASVAITPGHLIKTDSAGTVAPHNVVLRYAEKMFATEDVNVLQGKGIDDVYAIDDLVSYVRALPGDKIYAWLKDGETIIKGDQLVSNGDGTLKKIVTAAADYIVAIADEALDLAGGAAAAGRIRVEVA